MAVQIFNLRGVPDDEAEDIRQLLVTNHIEHYETPAGLWGMSSPALWITDDDQRKQVTDLIAQYQQQRALDARQLYETQKAHGQHLTLRGLVKLHPLRYVAALLAIAFIVFVSVGPFLKWMGHLNDRAGFLPHGTAAKQQQVLNRVLGFPQHKNENIGDYIIDPTRTIKSITKRIAISRLISTAHSD